MIPDTVQWNLPIKDTPIIGHLSTGQIAGPQWCLLYRGSTVFRCTHEPSCVSDDLPTLEWEEADIIFLQP